jgi:heme/copper-type cytochrome/quinol oxidase subunit 4
LGLRTRRGVGKAGLDKFTFNAQSEKQQDLAEGKGYFYETDFRGYDAQIGRFHGYDLLASAYSGAIWNRSNRKKLIEPIFKKRMKITILFIILEIFTHIIIFVLLRYLSVLIAFLAGMANSGELKYYEHEHFIYIPFTVLQILVSLIFFLRSYRKSGNVFNTLKYITIIVIIFLLSIAGFLKIIPYEIIPY